jgi:hypothetical protein
MGKSTRFAIEHYPMNKNPSSEIDEQGRQFIDAARKLGTDEDPERFRETVRKLASAPVTRNGPSKAKKPKSE